ncbi:hypothetical protein LJC01_01645 [Clostridiaceae bacterium OttesenSCG-928-D20]|nr:hypothetical protein [Clostridiaceae bacterium OttesenSCG-928-D20]
MQRIYTLLVENKTGVLDRIVGLIRRYGWNISSIVAAETENPGFSIITIAVACMSEIRIPDSSLRDLDFVKSVNVSKSSSPNLKEFLVARGKKGDFGALIGLALKSEEEAGIITAYWAGTNEEIADIQKELAKNKDIILARSGAIIMQKQMEVE